MRPRPVQAGRRSQKEPRPGFSSSSTRMMPALLEMFAPASALLSAMMLPRRYQPDFQFPGLVDRLIFVNLYSIPTEIAKFTSVDVVYGA